MHEAEKREAPGQRKTVLITGATDGLGRASAILLAQRGYRVFAAGRSNEKRAQLDALARAKNFPLETVELDVCDEDSVQNAVAHVLAKAGAIDVLFNNAGVNYSAAVEDLRISDWRRQFETNFFGALRVTQAVVPHMRERRRGRILMMSSVSGFVTAPTQGAYSSSKFAMEAMSNALRLELYPFGVKVILIEPGYIVTGIQQTAMELSGPYLKESASPYASLYARFLKSMTTSRAASETTPEDCAQVVLEAIEAPRPKIRYPVTRLAFVAKWLKRLLSDRAVDGMMRRRFGIVREG
jgi:NAD(P)-dependent dehydrogenase (short-subunit alcohol dehydrogenase family)